MDSMKELLIRTIEEAAMASPLGDWGTSPYAEILSLSADTRGDIGERLCAEILSAHGFEVSDDIGQTDSYGERSYDFTVDGVGVEVKFATRGKRRPTTFQHERLDKRHGWEILIIVDVAPQKIYAEITAKRDLPWSRMHVRPSGLYKYDLSVKYHEARNNEVKSTAEFVERFSAALARIRSDAYRKTR